MAPPEYEKHVKKLQSFIDIFVDASNTTLPPVNEAEQFIKFKLDKELSLTFYT